MLTPMAANTMANSWSSASPSCAPGPRSVVALLACNRSLHEAEQGQSALQRRRRAFWHMRNRVRVSHNPAPYKQQQRLKMPRATGCHEE